MTPLLGILYRNAITSFSFSKDKQLIFTSCTISLVSVPDKNTIRTANKCHHYLSGYFSFYFPKTKYLQYIRQVPARVSATVIETQPKIFWKKFCSGWGVALIVACRLAVRQARVRISARHPSTELKH
jgi:hypothetical protein